MTRLPAIVTTLPLALLLSACEAAELYADPSDFERGVIDDDDDDDDAENAPRPELSGAASLRADDDGGVWLGSALGIAAPEVTERGEVPLPTSTDAELLVAAMRERGMMSPNERGEPDELGAALSPRSAGDLDDLAMPALGALEGKSGEDDTRVCFGDNEGCVEPKGAYPFNVIGTFGDGPGCTGTQVGPVHIITAAHCVRSGGAKDAMKGLRWYPGYSDGPAAVGSVKVERVYTHPMWQEEGSGFYDYALVITEERLVNSWMGFGYRPQSELLTRDLYNRGYPVRRDIAPSDDPTDPTCADWSPPDWSAGQGRLYGDSYTRRIAGHSKFRAPDPISMWSRIFVTAHDTGAGHSGSPHYAYEADGPWIYGIHRSECTPGTGGTDAFCEWSGADYECSDTITYNSQAIRLEPTNVGVIAYWRSLWGVDAAGSSICLVDECGGEFSY